MHSSRLRASAAALLFACATCLGAAAAPTVAQAQSIAISVRFGPPPIPYYVQPPAPHPDYIWSPGYWAYDPDHGYYWVPGTWVLAPEAGLYWTPGYWAWNGATFIFTSGYWAPQVGWYGGIDYGYGYYGNGYVGGRWHGRHFLYNTAITNVNRTYVHNTYVYNDPHVRATSWNRVSYNGGRGGIVAHASPRQIAYAQQRRFGPTNTQLQHASYAASDRALRVAVNHGRPATAAVVHPLGPAYHGAARPMTAAHPATPHGAPQQHAFAAPHHAAPMAHAYAPPAHAAPMHAAPAPQAHHYAPPAAQQHHAAPQQHYAAPQMQHHAAPQMQHGGPAPHEHGGPQGGPHGGGGQGRHDHG